MPTYEYACLKCKVSYELRQGFDAETTHTCEECGNGVAKRILHAPRVVFKGSGWYATDSRKSRSAVSESSSSDSSDGAASSSDASEGGDTATKPAPPRASPEKSSGTGAEAAAAG